MLTRAELERRLRVIIADAALVQPAAFAADEELNRCGIDSLSMLRAIAMIESEFNVVIDDEEFAGLRTLRELVAAVERCVVADAA